MSVAEWSGVVIAPVVIALVGSVGYALKRLILAADSAQRLRFDALEEKLEGMKGDITGLANRHDGALIALNDLIRDGFATAAEDRSTIAQQVARIEGHLGWPSLRGVNGG